MTIQLSNISLLYRNNNHEAVKPPREIEEIAFHAGVQPTLVEMRERFEAMPKLCSNQAEAKRMKALYSEYGKFTNALTNLRAHEAAPIFDLARKIESVINDVRTEVEYWRGDLRRRFSAFDTQQSQELELRTAKLSAQRQKLEIECTEEPDRQERMKKVAQVKELKLKEKELCADRKDLHISFRKSWAVKSWDSIEQIAHTHPEFLEGNAMKVEQYVRAQLAEGKPIHEGSLAGITLEEVTVTVYRQ